MTAGTSRPDVENDIHLLGRVRGLENRVSGLLDKPSDELFHCPR